MRTGRSGIRLIENLDRTPLVCQIAGEVDNELLGDEFSSYDRFARLALVAAGEAAEQAQLADATLDRTRIATLIGSGLGGAETENSAYARIYRDGATRLPPVTIPRAMYNAATSAVSSSLNLLGPAYAISSACSSGTHAIGQASLWIRTGIADIVVAGAADAPISPAIIRGWESLRVLAPAGDHPAAACRPFSADRAGMVLAEGAAVLVLESAESAARRGVELLAEIAGAGLSSDAGHLTDPSSDGASRAMKMALADARAPLTDIGYINAHGTATRANDPTETAAIKETFKELVYQIPVSSTKSVHGHAMGASGAIEAALSILALNESVIPATMHYNEADPQCDLDYVPNFPRQGKVRMFLSNSFGFGGLNGVLAIRTKWGV